MKYLKVFTDFDEVMSELSDEEKGRLFVAMIRYARDGQLPALIGNERILWSTAKIIIDREIASNEANTANGSKGGQAKSSESKRNVAKSSEDKRNVAKTSETKRNLADKDKEKDKEEKNSPNGEQEKSELDIALDEFKAYRKEKGNKVTPLSEKKMLNKLERLSGGDDEKKIEILNQTMENGWTGVFAIKDGVRGRPRDYEEHPVEAGKFDHLFADLGE